MSFEGQALRGIRVLMESCRGKGGRREGKFVFIKKKIKICRKRPNSKELKNLNLIERN